MSRYTPAEATSLLAEFIGEHTFRFEDEDALQRGLAQVLGDFKVEREYRINSRNRIDFRVHTADGARIGVEVKVAGAAPEVEAQCKRYLASGEIDGLVLVTTRRRHRTVEPSRFDKPFASIWLGNSGF